MNKTKVSSGKLRKAAPGSRSRGDGRKPATYNRARSNGAQPNGSAAVRARGGREELEWAIQRYADLYDLAPVAYITFDRAGRIEQVNQATCELLGQFREYLIGGPVSLHVDQPDTKIFLEHLVRCRAGERRTESNLHLKRRGGETISVFISSTPTMSFLDDGGPLYLTAIIDLTERERAEQALREKELELEQIVTQTPFMLTRCTRDLRYRYVSHAYAKMLGLSPEALAGRPIVEIIGEEGMETLRPHIKRVLAGETVSYESVVSFKEIGPRFLHAVSVPDKNERGQVVGWIASIIDITERRRAEEASQRLAAVVQSSHDAIVAKTLDGIITDWNESAQRIFGYKPKEIIGKSILTLIPIDRRSEEREIMRRIRRGESIEHYQTVRQRKDGKLIDVSLTISPVKDANGKIVGVSKIARDITAQKKAERLLAEQARLLDLSNEAILARDENDRITYWNHGAQELYGYSAKEALRKIAPKLLRTEYPEGPEQIHKQLQRDGRWSGELVRRRKDGARIVVMSRWALDRNAGGKRLNILETNSDITLRKQAENALHRSKELLEKLVQQRTRALRVANSELESEIRRRKGLEGQILEISDREQERLGQELHDGLCQQLTAIGFLARATALRLKDHRVVQVDDLERIAQLINGSVIDARNIARDLHKEEIAAAEFVPALEDLVDRKIWKTPCKLEFKTNLEIENDTVASQLYRILREALINSNKHAAATKIVLSVKRVRNDLLFSVTDNGVGFTTRNRGHGLGFHIMKYRAESIGGRLELHSLKKGGARVTCHLPISMIK